ncbi:MAG: hypothetical protein IJ802_02095, partial [Kiritimatiellae bacterium]|nr:hypothetical protein [Kiritimatiellia bacterium]
KAKYVNHVHLSRPHTRAPKPCPAMLHRQRKKERFYNSTFPPPVQEKSASDGANLACESGFRVFWDAKYRYFVMKVSILSRKSIDTSCKKYRYFKLKASILLSHQQAQGIKNPRRRSLPAVFMQTGLCGG